jgi:hypothetical protein
VLTSAERRHGTALLPRASAPRHGRRRGRRRLIDNFGWRARALRKARALRLFSVSDRVKAQDQPARMVERIQLALRVASEG